jgi:hypothetical protein
VTTFTFVSTHRAVLSEIARAAAETTSTVTLIVADGQGPAVIDGIQIIDVGNLRQGRIAHALDRSVITRTLVRLSPADRGARMSRRLRRHSEARATFQNSEVIVACDRDSCFATWSRLAENPAARLALYGLAGGLAAVRQCSTS